MCAWGSLSLLLYLFIYLFLFLFFWNLIRPRLCPVVGGGEGRFKKKKRLWSCLLWALRSLFFWKLFCCAVLASWLVCGGFFFFFFFWRGGRGGWFAVSCRKSGGDRGGFGGIFGPLSLALVAWCYCSCRGFFRRWVYGSLFSDGLVLVGYVVVGRSFYSFCPSLFSSRSCLPLDWMDQSGEGGHYRSRLNENFAVVQINNYNIIGYILYSSSLFILLLAFR